MSLAIAISIFNLPLVLAEFSSNVANTNAGASIAVSETWDGLWKTALEGPLYEIIANLGAVVAVIAIGFFVVDFARSWMDGHNLSQLATKALVPFLIVILLSNGGTLLAEISMGLRDSINTVNNQILLSVGEIDFEATLSEMADYSSVKNEIETLRSQCDVFIDEEKMQACLDSTTEASERLLNAFESGRGRNASSRRPEMLQEQIEVNSQNPFTLATTASASLAAASGISGIAGTVNLLGSAGRGLFRLGRGGLLFTIETVLVGFQIAFQHIVEMSMLLTALLGPIVIAASIFPIGNTPLFGWITGFLSVGMVKLSYNIIIGFVAVAYSASDSRETLPLTIAIAILAPILSVLIATGGGFTIFSGIQSLAGQAVSLGTRYIK
ncbi:MAG: hypothetical protein AAF327_09735 [Cyanobacteria bacterium P01_A01_bin.37]